MTVIVNDQKKKHGEQIDFKVVQVGTGDSMAEIEKAKLDKHGIIAKGKDGKLLTKGDGHSYGEEKVAEVVAKLLAAK